MQNQNNQQGVAKNVANTIKNGADVAFDAAQNAIKATEDVAMTAVDATANVIDQATKGAKNMMGNQQNQNKQ